MKRVLSAIGILCIFVLSFFCFVACGSQESPALHTNDPNEFIEFMKDAKDITYYGYDEYELLKVSYKSNGEISITTSRDGVLDSALFVIKENNAFTGYYMETIYWYKTNDPSKYEDMLNYYSIASLTAAITDIDPFVKSDDGFWYSENATDAEICIKMEDGKMLIYNKYEAGIEKIAMIEFKAEIILPEEAKNAQLD